MNEALKGGFSKRWKGLILDPVELNTDEFVLLLGLLIRFSALFINSKFIDALTNFSYFSGDYAS